MAVSGEVAQRLRAVSARGVHHCALYGRAVLLPARHYVGRASAWWRPCWSVFSIRYRKAVHPVATQIEGSTLLEATWTIIPLGLFLICFVWGALLYFRIYNPPVNSMNIYIVGKQWMWKAEHPGGQHEINALHVPTGQPIQLTMISQDVFHSFSIPDVPHQARGDSRPLQHGMVRGHHAGRRITSSARSTAAPTTRR